MRTSDKIFRTPIGRIEFEDEYNAFRSYFYRYLEKGETITRGQDPNDPLDVSLYSAEPTGTARQKIVSDALHYFHHGYVAAKGGA